MHKDDPHTALDDVRELAGNVTDTARKLLADDHAPTVDEAETFTGQLAIVQTTYERAVGAAQADDTRPLQELDRLTLRPQRPHDARYLAARWLQRAQPALHAATEAATTCDTAPTSSRKTPTDDTGV